MNFRKTLVAVLCLIMVVGTLAGCSGKSATSSVTSSTSSSASTAEKLKVGVLYISTKNDGGWSQAHATGFKNAVEAIGADKVELMEIESIEDTDTVKTEASLRQLAESGCKIIFATSFNYMDTVDAMAKEYPDIKWEHCSGAKSNDTNFANYFAQIEQPRYLAGIIAGYATKTNKIGYVAAQPFAEVVRGLNAFTMGARSVNPKVQVYVEWTMSWYAPDKEKENAISLINKGVDVMAQHQDSPAAVTAAEQAGILSIGYDFSMASFAPKGYLTAPVFNWGSYYESRIKAVLDGTWKAGALWEGMKENMVGLDAYGAKVSDEAKAKVETVKATLLEKGNAAIFVGPIKDNTGKVQVPEGKTLTKEEQYSMNWLVEGVVGNLPK